eukprot:9474795-Pyramimonas_sp.AAC.1
MPRRPDAVAPERPRGGRSTSRAPSRAQHHGLKRTWRGFQHDLKTTRTRHTFAGLSPAAGFILTQFFMGGTRGWLD